MGSLLKWSGAVVLNQARRDHYKFLQILFVDLACWRLNAKRFEYLTNTREFFIAISFGLLRQ